VAVHLDRIRDLIGPAVDLRSVLRRLMRQEIVLPGIDGTLTRQVMIQGLTGSPRRRYVVFVEKALVERAGILAAVPQIGNRRLRTEWTVKAFRARSQRTAAKKRKDNDHRRGKNDDMELPPHNAVRPPGAAQGGEGRFREALSSAPTARRALMVSLLILP
jgi:hypothetical protein